MSLDTVVEDIRNEAEAQAQEILESAETEADRIVEEAETEADRIQATAEAEVARQIERERDQRISSATLEAKQKRLEARREVLSTVRDRVESAIEDLPAADREALTRTLLEDALSEFEDATVRVYARPADQDLLEDILEAHDEAELAGEYDCLGGVVVESEGGRLRVDNTFDSILEEVWGDILKELSDILFEGQ